MNPTLRISSSRGQLWCFLLFLIGGAVFASLIVYLVLSVAQGNGHAGAVTPAGRSIGLMKGLQAFYTVTTFLAPAFLYAYFIYGSRPFGRLGFRKASKTDFYLLAIVLLLLSIPFVGWLGQLNHAIRLPDWMMHREKEADQELVAYLKTGSAAGVLVNVILIAVLPAICEEACFRGALQPILIRMCKNPWAGIILTAIIFSAIHMQFEGFLPRMFLGMLLGAVYWYSGSLWVSVAAHFFMNAIQVVAVSFYPKFITEDPSVPLPIALVSMVIVGGLLIFLHRYSGPDPGRAHAEEIP